MANEMKAPERCCKRVWVQGARRGHQCERTGSVEREGKLYCKQHDPVAVKERHNRRNKQFAERWEQEARIRRVQNVAPEMLALLKRYVENDPCASGDQRYIDAVALIERAEGKTNGE